MRSGQVAFAMGGLAGNNAHGAGFLEAALEKQVLPIMISCTSGQILWVYRYLELLRKGRRQGLRARLEEDIREVRPTGEVNLDWECMTMFGKQNVARPAVGEYWADMSQNISDVFRHLYERPGDVLLVQEWMELFPARALVPAFPDEFYDEIAQAFVDEKRVGIVFNSYNPGDGTEYVFLNEAARKLLGGESGQGAYAPRMTNHYRDRTIYQEITPQAVQDALWVYQYGFDRGSRFVDGAYFRQIILSELTAADVIFAVRPINHCWKGHLPRNYPELEDLKTEIGFDGSYCGERSQIKLINALLEAGALAAAKAKYHGIKLVELEIKRPRGFFDYVFEDMDVFEDAYKQGKEALCKPEAPSGGPRSARVGSAALEVAT